MLELCNVHVNKNFLVLGTENKSLELENLIKRFEMWNDNKIPLYRERCVSVFISKKKKYENVKWLSWTRAIHIDWQTIDSLFFVFISHFFIYVELENWRMDTLHAIESKPLSEMETLHSYAHYEYWFAIGMMPE